MRYHVPTEKFSMTDDFEPVSQTPSPGPLPVYGEENEIIESESRETFLDPNGEFILEEPSPTPVAAVKTPEPIWVRLRRAIFGAGSDGYAEHFRYLEQAIENAPRSPGNYVLRGELYLKVREYALAQHDFQRGYELAARQFERSDWGLIAQAMQDRALSGLQKAQNKLKATDHQP